MINKTWAKENEKEERVKTNSIFIRFALLVFTLKKRRYGACPSLFFLGYIMYRLLTLVVLFLSITVQIRRKATFLNMLECKKC